MLGPEVMTTGDEVIEAGIRSGRMNVADSCWLWVDMMNFSFAWLRLERLKKGVEIDDPQGATRNRTGMLILGFQCCCMQPYNLRRCRGLIGTAGETESQGLVCISRRSWSMEPW